MAIGESADAGRPLRLALVGCGWFAVRAHLPALEKLERTSTKALGFRVCLYALCSRSAANVERARKRSLGAYTHTFSLLLSHMQRARAWLVTP
jgi:predicted dehydrogenase